MPRKFLLVCLLVCTLRGFAEKGNRPGSAVSGSISGTVVDVNDGIVPGATVVLHCESPCKEESAVAGDTGSFEFKSLSLGSRYEIAVRAEGFKDWTSAPITLTPEQSVFLLTDVRIEAARTTESVTVYASRDEIATEQVRLAEHQRVLGVIPNFYVVYDPKNAVPLSSKLKFKLAMRTALDPVTVSGVVLLAGVQQAGGTPNYVGGAKGYGQRLGADAASGFSSILLGSAILPSLLHQDPRYFCQGTGTTSSRLKHAIFSPFITRGDNGRSQVNFSSLGGDLASSALSETYFPNSNRGPGLVFGNFAIGTGERMAGAVLQEFILRRLTPSARKQREGVR
ncbi:carboxypeptidase-like regulatory domain-containing protein [Occallatibacter riparius]|uniref:Carboxypeptidase-like regulatory domain-containing protein n=1 Tax=Occallatibacter riparius TaxID=1002689 RepID=A0A9J7BQT9_9BACT|nr:carboxypeptidase-like regulatory domain-containing protein [Occallatibacter riparius]UWZ85187.1 carboxypeptidase-like regulatory domain-containing protein [Occallatibacter riparius]